MTAQELLIDKFPLPTQFMLDYNFIVKENNKI